MLKIRRSRDSLIFDMGVPILVRRHLYTEKAPWVPFQYKDHLSRYRDSQYKDKINGLRQACSISSALKMEIQISHQDGFATILSLWWEFLYWQEGIFILRWPPAYFLHSLTPAVSDLFLTNVTALANFTQFSNGEYSRHVRSPIMLPWKAQQGFALSFLESLHTKSPILRMTSSYSKSCGSIVWCHYNT